MSEHVEGVAQASEPCWFPMDRTGYAFEWGEGTPHWTTIEQANEGVSAILKQYEDGEQEPPSIALHRESEGCWHLTCAECGYRYDEDEWISHFPAEIDAKAAAEDCEWRVVHGRALCSECSTELVAAHEAATSGKESEASDE